MSLIVFSHANSFGASTYKVMFNALRDRGHSVFALERYGHDSAYPVTNNWTHLARQLRDFALKTKQEQGQTPALIGHSLGGILSLMCAARHPELASSVVLLDSPVVSGWKAAFVRVGKATGFMRRIPPVSISARRRDVWDSQHHVVAHLGSKPAFKSWDAQVLADFAAYGTYDVSLDAGVTDAELSPGHGDLQTRSSAHLPRQRRLAFKREIESAIYATLPDRLPQLLRRHPLQCPLHFIGGESSWEVSQCGLDEVRRLISKNPLNTLQMTPGSHLFPMENPRRAASLIHNALLVRPN